jgi:hypothetical protein
VEWKESEKAMVAGRESAELPDALYPEREERQEQVA